MYKKTNKCIRKIKNYTYKEFKFKIIVKKSKKF